MNPYSLLIQNILKALPIRASLLFLILCLSCSHGQVPDIAMVREKWVGQPIDTILAKLQKPHHRTIHPDGKTQYVFHFSENRLFINIFRGEPLDDMSTIRVQEEIARTEQSSCRLEIWSKNGTITHINTYGQGCRKIRETMDRE